MAKLPCRAVGHPVPEPMEWFWRQLLLVVTGGALLVHLGKLELLLVVAAALAAL